MGEPTFTTSYEDLFNSPVTAGNEHQLTIIGLASDGPMDTAFSATGLAGAANVDTLFGTTQRLPRGVREAITGALDAQTRNPNMKPISVNGIRAGADAEKSYIELTDDTTAVTAITITYDYYGEDGDEWQAKVEDDGTDYVVTVRRTASGTATQFSAAKASVTKLATIVQAINDSTLPLTATLGAEGPLAEVGYTFFDKGDNGEMTNAEILRVLTTLEGTAYHNLLFVGVAGTGDADATAFRAMLGTHCADSLSSHDQERYAFIECEEFSSANPAKSAAWLIEIEAWVAGIESALTSEADRNLIAFAGGYTFSDASATAYNAPATAYLAGVWLGAPIHRSMINLATGMDLTLLQPDIPKSYRDRLADARVNYARYDKDRGVIIGNCKTLAEDGSDFEDCEFLRMIYIAGAEWRASAKPFWGIPDDGQGSGTTVLKTGGDKAMDLRVGKNFTSYTTVVSVDDDGDTYCDVGVVPFTTLKSITHRVYRRSA